DSLGEGPQQRAPRHLGIDRRSFGGDVPGCHDQCHAQLLRIYAAHRTPRAHYRDVDSAGLRSTEISSCSYHTQENPLILGRLTYESFAGSWPYVPDKPDADEGEKIYARKLNAMKKIVFSRTLDKVEWNNSTLFHDIN